MTNNRDDIAAVAAGERYKNVTRQTVSYVVAAIRAGKAESCVNIPVGGLVDPPEYWIADLGVWVMGDGSHIKGDLGRGYIRPNWLGRLRIRLAVKDHLERGA